MMDRIAAAAELAEAMVDDVLDPATNVVMRESIRLDPSGAMLARMIIQEIELAGEQSGDSWGLFPRTRRTIIKLSATPRGLAGLGQIPWASLITGVLDAAGTIAAATISADTQKAIARLQIKAAQPPPPPPAPATPPVSSTQATVAAIGETVSSVLPWAALGLGLYFLMGRKR